MSSVVWVVVQQAAMVSNPIRFRGQFAETLCFFASIKAEKYYTHDIKKKNMAYCQRCRGRGIAGASV